MRTVMAFAATALTLATVATAQQNPSPPLPVVPPPRADLTQMSATRISLDEAIRLALQHNHALLAAQSTILQNQAQEITANLRPNLTLSFDTQFFTLFNPGEFNTTYLATQAQFDAGIGYLFERGGKRKRRYQAAKDA